MVRVKKRKKIPRLAVIALVTLFGFLGAGPSHKNTSRLPYREAGLTDRQAAAHLISRFTYGARPGDIDRAVGMGLDAWLDEQLQGSLRDGELTKKFAPLKTLGLSTKEIVNTYPNPGIVLLAAYQDGIVDRNRDSLNSPEVRVKLFQYTKEKGFRPQRELIGELVTQKLFRALYSRNQLQEVLTDFWFNHFNVSLTDNQARPYVLTYERDAIRPFVFGRFREILGATAKHPAMLGYLDNAQSTAPEGTTTTMSLGVNKMRNETGIKGALNRALIDQALRNQQKEQDEAVKNLPPEFRPRKGINENYARELMELHTLGVDGGYTQQDVVDVARVFTGWTVYPLGPRGEKLRERIERGRRVGFTVEGDFLFRADAHDAEGKHILGQKFSAGRGVEEGERVLDMLAEHPSTASFISRKIAARFVSDNPPQSLVDRLAQVFKDTEGDLRAMIRTIAESPEFWLESSRRAKIKSPFEYAVSALRALDANVQRPRWVLEWMARMGQPLYAYSAPTGYPDRASQWINTGSLLNRMNFGLALAGGKIKGVLFDLVQLNGNREPESMEAALTSYAALLLPERNLDETLKRLTPVVRDPQFAKRLEEAVPAGKERNQAEETMQNDALFQLPKRYRQLQDDESKVVVAKVPPALGHVVGVIIGSPEFQRR